jgi:hypothetical protein
MDALNVRKAPCIYGEDCRNKHLTRAGNTRSLAQVERQVMEELRGNEGARLMEALRTRSLPSPTGTATNRMLTGLTSQYCGLWSGSIPRGRSR